MPVQGHSRIPKTGDPRQRRNSAKFASEPTVFDGVITLDTGGDTDIDIITLNMTGSPTFAWSESGDIFTFNKGVTVTGLITGSTITSTGLLTAGASITITDDLNHDGANAGFFGVTPTTRPTAFTQTFSAATKTHSNLTSATLTDNSGGSADATIAAITNANNAGSADVVPTADAIADLAAQVNALRVDLDNTKQVLNQAIDDLQTLGLLQ